MEDDKTRIVRRDEVGYCGRYCRTCNSDKDVIERPLHNCWVWLRTILGLHEQLISKVAVAKKRLRRLRYFQTMCAFSNAKVAAAGAAVEFENAVLQKALVFVLNAMIFRAKEISGVKQNLSVLSG